MTVTKAHNGINIQYPKAEKKQIKFKSISKHLGWYCVEINVIFIIFIRILFKSVKKKARLL